MSRTLERLIGANKAQGCDDRGIQRAMARFLSASEPEYNDKTLMFGIGTSVVS